MSLPLKAVDRLFDRLTATYGRDFVARFEGLDVNNVKTVWAHELSGFANQLPALAWALENLPERAPNVIEFRNLARRAPAPEVPRLPEPKADPARIAAELARLKPIRAPRAGGQDGRDWARRIIARHAQGDSVRPICLAFARQALGVDRVAVQEAP